MVKLLSYIFIGGLIGAALGYFGKCTTGACPFTANPFRGAGFGALFGLLIGFSSVGNPFQSRAAGPESPAIIHVENADELAALVAASPVPVLLDFYADWCGPCRRLAPELSAVADLWGDHAKIVKINVDKQRDIAESYKISSIPDLRILVGGVEKERLVGYRNRDRLSESLLAAGGVLAPAGADINKEKPSVTTDNEGSESMIVALKVGDKAPDFKLKNQDGESVSLSDYAGKKLLIYFYPKANTPGCTAQSCAVSESLDVLREAGVEAVGISPDSPEAQKKFDEKYKLGFPLLADEDKAVAEAYGVWGEKSMYGKRFFGIVRSAFLVGEDGKLMAVRYKVSPSDTVPFVKEAAKL